MARNFAGTQATIDASGQVIRPVNSIDVRTSTGMSVRSKRFVLLCAIFGFPAFVGLHIMRPDDMRDVRTRDWSLLVSFVNLFLIVVGYVVIPAMIRTFS